MGRLGRWLGVCSIGAVCAACGSANAVPSATGVAGLRQAAEAYAGATLNGRFGGVERALSPECRATDHITAENLPSAEVTWQRQLGVSFSSIRVTGVDVRDVTPTSAQAEVTFNLPVGNDNWVHYVLDDGKWSVGGECVVPVGNFESSSGSG